MAEINVVPYIDVMLVLLVIFMITAPLLMQGVKVTLPTTQASRLAQQLVLPIIVSVDRQGRYYLNVSEYPDHPLNGLALMTQIAARLSIAKEQHHQQAIFVKGDREANYEMVVRAMSLLQRAGAHEVSLITQPDSIHSLASRKVD